MSTRSTGTEQNSTIRLRERRPSARQRAESERALQRFVRLEYWNGFAAGDVVRVAGHTSRGRHWRFRAHVTNTSNGASWVELALVEGPAPSRRPVPGLELDESDGNELRVERIRSFDPELVSARWSLLGARRPKAPRRTKAESPPGQDGLDL